MHKLKNELTAIDIILIYSEIQLPDKSITKLQLCKIKDA